MFLLQVLILVLAAVCLAWGAPDLEAAESRHVRGGGGYGGGGHGGGGYGGGGHGSHGGKSYPSPTPGTIMIAHGFILNQID